MARVTPRLLFLLASAIAAAGDFAWAAEPEARHEDFRYPAGTHAAGRLRYIDGLPVLTVAGTPEEIGEQIGVLAAKPAIRLQEYPRQLLKHHGVDYLYPILTIAGKGVLPRFPEDHRRELEALIRASGADYDVVVGINALDDMSRARGCSSVTVDAEQTTTGGPLVARNLDYDSLGYVQHYSLVTVYQPAGKLAFACTGFPGVVGVHSGMNETGLTLIIHDVNHWGDGSPNYDPSGEPMLLTFRRVLEECRTVAEAEKLLRATPRTTQLNVTICDPHDVAVFELTPKSVVLRRDESGWLVCTNHFRSPELSVNRPCWRYEALGRPAEAEKFDVPALWGHLHRASVKNTLQSMIFEPSTLKLHFAFGELPATKAPPRMLELEALFRE